MIHKFSPGTLAIYSFEDKTYAVHLILSSQDQLGVVYKSYRFEIPNNVNRIKFSTLNEYDRIIYTFMSGWLIIYHFSQGEYAVHLR